MWNHLHTRMWLRVIRAKSVSIYSTGVRVQLENWMTLPSWNANWTVICVDRRCSDQNKSTRIAYPKYFQFIEGIGMTLSVMAVDIGPKSEIKCISHSLENARLWYILWALRNPGLFWFCWQSDFMYSLKNSSRNSNDFLLYSYFTALRMRPSVSRWNVAWLVC